MAFTAPAALRSQRDPASSAGGYVMLFRIEEIDWVVAWYEEETAINLPGVHVWLRHARPEHRWFATFRPSQGEALAETLAAVNDGESLALEIGGVDYPVEHIDDLHGVLGRIPWRVLAGAGEAPSEPARSRP